MKKPSTHLFKLVKSLTKSEKRAFRSSKGTNKESTKYGALFDAIDAQDIYDEEALKRKFKEENWVKRFSVAKDYVQKALLSQLSTYNQLHDPSYELTDLMMQIRVLQQKGFYSRCAKMISKGKEKANQINDYLKLLELLTLESLNHPGGINPVQARNVHQEQIKTLKLLENQYAYDLLYKKSYGVFSKTGYAGFEKEDQIIYQNLMKSDLLQSIETAKTFNAKRQFINMHYFYALGTENIDSMRFWILEAVDLFEKNDSFIHLYPVNYATTLLNLHDSFLKQKQFKEALKVLDKLGSFYPKEKLKEQDRLTYLIEYGGLHNKMSTLNEMGAFEGSYALKNQLLIYLNKHEQEISKSILTRHNYLLAITCFGVAKYKDSLEILNLILNNKALEVRTDLIKKSQILRFLVYYELDKLDLLEYNMRSVKRSIQKSGKLNKLEKHIFKAIGHLISHFEDRYKMENDLAILEQLKTEDNFVPNYTEFLNWLKSKIEKVSYAELVKNSCSFGRIKDEKLIVNQ